MPAPSTPRRRALVVDADPVARQQLRQVLQDSGCAVREAVSGVAAVIAARAEAPDVIVMDMQLPDVPGQQAVEWLRALPGGKKIPLITLTWRPWFPAAGSAAAGPVLDLAKPVSSRALRQAIGRILAGDANVCWKPEVGSQEHRG